MPPQTDIVVVSVHARDAGVLSPVAGWQVMVMDLHGHQLIGEVHRRRAQAMAFASRHFGDIVGWRRLESTAWAAARRADVPIVLARTRQRLKTGPQVPRWRSGTAG